MRGRELVDRIAGELTDRLGAGGAALVARQPRALRDGRAAARAVARARRRDRARERRPRRRVDRHRLARDDGERGPQRPRAAGRELVAA